MQTTLTIVPRSMQQDKETLDRHLSAMALLSPGERNVFYFDQNNALELKKLLLEQKYEVIIIGFPSVHVEYPEIQMVRSLSGRSRLILYYPDLGFVKKMEASRVNRDSDLLKWQDLGRSLQLNLCRMADLVVVDSPEEKELLKDKINGTPVLSAKEIAPGAAAPANSKKHKVSIIILTFNQLVDTRRTVESLMEHTKGIDHELIFVYNGSTDATRQYLEDLRLAHDNIQVIFNAKNVGFAKANNQGMAIASGDYLLLLNNDVVITEGWLERMLVCAESDPAIGVVGPCTNKAVGQQLINVTLPIENAEIQKFASMQAMKNAGYWFETHRIIGFCLLMKREVIEKVGMLDERFGPGGFEDYDFCLRVKQANYKIMVASDVFVYHIGGQGYTKNNLDYDKLRYQNIQIFIEKWCKKALEVLEIMPDGI